VCSIYEATGRLRLPRKGLTWPIASLASVAASLLADSFLAHAQNISNFMLRFSGFPHSVDDLTVLLAEM
jgi:hypothetical protein